MPAGRHPQSLAQHPAPAELLLMLWSFFKLLWDGDAATRLGNQSWAAPPSWGGGFPKSPTRIYKAVLGAHSSREGGHCLHLSGTQSAWEGISWALKLCLSLSEAAQVCLLTDVHIQMQWWKIIAFPFLSLFSPLQVAKTALLTALECSYILKRKEFSQTCSSNRISLFLAKEMSLPQHCLKPEQHCPQLRAANEHSSVEGRISPPNLRARQINPESNSTPMAWERSHEWSFHLLQASKALLNVQWGRLSVHYWRSSSKRTCLLLKLTPGRTCQASFSCTLGKN